MMKETARDIIRINITATEQVLAEQKATRDKYEPGSICYGVYDSIVARFEGKIEAYKEAFDLLA